MPNHARMLVAPLIIAASCLFASAASAQYSSPMRDVENPDRFPFQERFSITIPVGYLNGFGLIPTPTGYRYVIEYVSLTCSSPDANDSFPQAYLNVTKITSPSSTIGFGVNAINMERTGSGTFSGWVFSGSANVKLYSDYSPFDANGGNGISMNIFHTSTANQVSCNGVVSGHTLKL